MEGNIMIEYFKFIEELKNIKKDLNDLPARRLKLIDLAIDKYEKLIKEFEEHLSKEEAKYMKRHEDELMEEALNPLGKYKLVEDGNNEDVNNPDYEKYAGRFGKSVKEWKKENNVIASKLAFLRKTIKDA